MHFLLPKTFILTPPHNQLIVTLEFLKTWFRRIIIVKVNTCLSTPESQGNYHDFIELLKLYDKNSNGTMMLAELENLLSNLGDEIPKEDVQKLLAELCDAEDEDGELKSFL